MLPICCPRVIHNRLQPRCAPYAVVSLWSFVSAAQVEARDQTQRGRRCVHRPAGISSASFRTAREVVERSRCGILRPPQSGSMNVESRDAGC